MTDLPAPEPAEETGAPAWVMTFADLMSLLMCFFVLLLSFSEMDVLKFKQLAGSMQEAFGVQRQVKVKEIPKGTSIVRKEFSPGKPEHTIRNSVRQHTTDDHKRNLEVDEGKEVAAREPRPVDAREIFALQARVDAAAIRKALEEEIEKGQLDVETEQQRIIVRIREKGSFPSGSAELIVGFKPIIGRISDVLSGIEGQLVIAGHTDDVPISTPRFRSNWELAAARAVSVLEHLLAANPIPESRFVIEGHADSRPLAPNDSAPNRARNRRVEIVVIKGEDRDGGSLGALSGAAGGVAPAPGERRGSAVPGPLAERSTSHAGS